MLTIEWLEEVLDIYAVDPYEDDEEDHWEEGFPFERWGDYNDREENEDDEEDFDEDWDDWGEDEEDDSEEDEEDKEEDEDD